MLCSAVLPHFVPPPISGTGSVIELDKKMMAAEVFIAINEAFEKFREQHEDSLI